MGNGASRIALTLEKPQGMKREIIFAPLARLEFEDAVAWYEKQHAGLGGEFSVEVHIALQKVLISPERFRLASSTMHKTIMHNAYRKFACASRSLS